MAAHPCRHVLVVEDDPDLRETICDFLRGEEIEVIEAESGDAGLAALQREPLPDVILLDLKVPGLPGTELLARLKDDPRWAAIPVAVMSGFHRNHFQFAPAADEFLEKPFDLERLNEAVSALCRKSRARASDQAG
jgi:DNA-binding response OmpR family regulator